MSNQVIAWLSLLLAMCIFTITIVMVSEFNDWKGTVERVRVKFVLGILLWGVTILFFITFMMFGVLGKARLLSLSLIWSSLTTIYITLRYGFKLL